MRIRRATAADLDGVNRLLCQVLAVHHEGRPDLFKGGTKKYTDEELCAILTSEQTPVFAAFDDADTMLGYCFCEITQHIDHNILTPIKTLYIDDLCVDETCRGQHVGKALYTHVLDFAKAVACYNVTLNVWAFNESAIRFYERMGMKPQKIGMETVIER